MADGSNVVHSGEPFQTPDDSRLRLIQEHFGSSQTGSVETVDALSSRFPLKELTESIKILTENVRELRSCLDGGVSRRNDSRSGVADTVRVNNQIDLLSLSGNSHNNSIGASTVYAQIANSGSAIRPFDPFDPANLPAREQSAPAAGSFTSSSTPSVPQLAVKKFSHFPTFWKNTPELWLEEIEEKFNSLGISSDKEKFHYAITSLGGDVVAELADSIRNLPRDNRYESLKNVLVRKYIEHPKALMNRFDETLAGPMSSRRPSEFLDALCGAGSSFLDKNAILQFWKLKLPPQIAVHLSSVVDKENERSVVARADEVFYQLQNSGRMIHKIDVDGAVAVGQSCRQDSAFESFASEIKEVIREISRSIAQLNKPSARQSRRESSGPYCFYHTKYKEKAMKCPPEANCKWKEHNLDNSKN
uniref:DUF7041 domain-containing protein n=1 Tax=Trichogramma kaykai TaxID=54128 RepID=A0ABD2XRD2_9HYME